MAKAKSQQSLDRWTRQKWRTKSGKPSTQGPKATGERYLPEAAIKAMSSSQYAASSAKKRKQVNSFLNNLKAQLKRLHVFGGRNGS
jgi:hypothetical protein